MGTIKKIIAETISRTNLHPVNELYHQYKPFGVTGIVLLSESHLSIHTWPEFEYAAVDVFTCSDEHDPENALKILSDLIGASKTNIQTLKRGVNIEQ